MPTKSVAIIGGGFGGCTLASELESKMAVTLIEPREAFVHAPAMIRALVDPNLLDASLIPNDRFLKSGRKVKDKAVAVDGDGVQLASGATERADYIVVATGSSNGGVFKPDGHDLAAFRQKQASLHNQIMAADRIVIVGAGAVGIELAGEIASALPSKTIVLISAHLQLLPTYPKRLGALLHKKLKRMGVEVLLGARATDLNSATEPSTGQLTLADGRVLKADLIIPAIGARPNGALLEPLPGVRQGKDGRIMVDGYLRPSSHPNVFACGDVINAGDAATIVSVSNQAPWLAKALNALASGKALSKIKPYAPWTRAPMLVPLGPDSGASYLMVATLGDWVTRKMKGGDLFVPKYRALLNQP